METTNLNINPASGNKSEKTEKAKNVATKAAQFGGAAAVGVAGTLAAEAMSKDADEAAAENAPLNAEDAEANTEANPEGAGEETAAGTHDHAEAPESGELTAEAVTDFNPNDIVIDPEEEIALVSPENPDEYTVVDVVLTEEELGGSLESDIDPTVEELIAEVEPEVGEVMYGGPDGWDEVDVDGTPDDDELLMADQDDVADDIDIADDLVG